jgi:hypothetical protein
MRAVGATVAWIAIALGCGGAEPGTTTTTPAGSGPADTSGARTGDAKLTAAECGAMLDHIVDLGHAEQKRTLAPDAVPTDQQIAEIKRKQRAEMTDGCVTLPRATYECAMRARSPGELRACDKS